MGVVAQGNDVVVATLERWLRFAREGEVNFVALVVCQAPDIHGCDFAGVVNMQPVALDGFALLLADLDRAAQARAVPAADPALGADYACFNMASGPAGYDAVTALIDAEMTRIREGAPAPLKVHFWMGSDGNAGLDRGARRNLFDYVVRPALGLVGAIETDKVGRSKSFWATRDIADACRAGERVPVIHGQTLRLPQAPVTITLREAEEWPHRNSNMRAWLKFAELLKSRGERVIFVRDTHKADEPLGDWPTAPPASRSLPHRMALYQSAKANLFVSNGPAVLGIFGDRPWLQFIEIMDDDHPYPVNTAKFWRENQGIAVGEQWPWARADQRIVWAKDDYETIVAAWDDLMAVRRAA